MEKLLLLCLIGGSVAVEWHYYGDHGIRYWTVVSPSCSGHRQSPIDIPSALSPSLKYSADLGQLTFVGYNSTAGTPMTLQNNGHTAVINLLSTDLPKLSGGGLPGEYTAVQFHFHWGSTDTKGSEHTFRGNSYPLELHVVHFKTEYNTLAEALHHDDGLAVLGFFYTISEEANPALEPLIEALEDVPFKDDSVDISINLDDVMASDRTEFYRYEGSLTTPGCDEVVVWTVFEGKSYISSEQLEQFRKLYEDTTESEEQRIDFNYRPPQMLNDRTVYKNYMSEVPTSFKWGYEGQQGANMWRHYYPKCNGLMQSPIDIPHNDDPKMAKFDPQMQLNTLQFNNYNTEVTGVLLNNGHSVQVNIDQKNIGISEGGLSGPYTAVQFHFHWGPNNKHGSEHTRQGISYPLELHVVHYKTQYESLAGALAEEDGLAVVGFFFVIGPDNNPGFTKLIHKLTDVAYSGLSATVSGFTLEDLTFDYLRKNESSGRHIPYYRYQGGLTTPPCLQIVTWSVVRDPIEISEAQMAEFRKLYHVTEEEAVAGHHEYIKENYRPTQPLNARRIFFSEDTTPKQQTSGTTSSRSDVIVYVITGLLLSVMNS